MCGRPPCCSRRHLRAVSARTNGHRQRMSFAEAYSFWRSRNWQGIKCLRRDVFRTCTLSVPFQCKTHRKLRHRRDLPASWQGRECARGGLPTSGATTRHRWLGAGIRPLRTRDATERAFRAKKGLPCGPAAQTIRPRLIWEQKPRFFSDVTGP